MSTYTTPSGAMRLALKAENIHTTETNFPLPIVFGSGGIPDGFWASGSGVYNDDGSDIVFTTISGVVMSHELMKFDRTNKVLGAWVKFPTLTSGVQEDFLIQWGNGISINDPSSDVFTNVYGGYDFKVAMHFMDPTATCTGKNLPYTPYPVDSDAYYNSATDAYDADLYVDNMLNSTYVCSGGRKPARIATPLVSGLNMSPVDVYQVYPGIPDNSTLSFTGDSPFSVFGWIYLRAGYYGNPVYFFRKEDEYSFYQEGGRLRLLLGDDDNSPTSPILVAKNATGKAISASVWAHVGCSYDGSETTDGMDLYASGVSVKNWVADPGAYPGMANTTSQVWVGKGTEVYPGATCAWGRMDGMYLVNKALSADDMATYSDSVNDSGTLLNVSGLVDPTTLSTQKPTITVHPVGATKAVGDYYTFSVTASGEGTLTYQWRLDGSPISGANSSTYFISYITTDEEGDYDVVVSNFAGSSISDTASLSVTQGGEGSNRYGGSLYYISGVLDADLIEANDSNVPIPIILDNSNISSDFWSNVYRVDGHDIVVTNVSGVPFPREIVSFNKGSKDLQMWVKFPTIDSSTDTEFLIQYGSTALNYPSTKSVWQGNYSGVGDHKMVLHFEDNGLDSAQYNHAQGRKNHQAYVGGGGCSCPPDAEPPTPMLYDDGYFGRAWHQNEWYPSPYMYGRCSDDSTLTFVSGVTDQAFTVRAWMWARGEEPDVNGYSAFDWTDLPIMCKGHHADRGEYYFGNIGEKLSFYTVDSGTSGNYIDWAIQGVMSNADITGEGWGSFGATFDGASGYAVYLNGDALASSDISSTYGSGTYTSMKDGDLPLELGRSHFQLLVGASRTYAWDTKWGEMIIYGGELSANQMKTQYQLESNADSSITWGSENEFDASGYIPPTDSGVPTITTGPVEQTVNVGDTAYFQVIADGASPLYYQWKVNAIPITGATDYLYVLPNVEEGDVGYYEVTVYNDYGVAYAGANLNVVTDDGSIIHPSGVEPAPSGDVPSGVVPGYSGTVPSGAIFSDAGDYIFADKSYQGYSAYNAVPIYNTSLGNLFYDDVKEDKFLFGNTSGEKKHYYVYVNGLNSGIFTNLDLSTDRDTWSQVVDFVIEDGDMRSIYMKYTVENNPTLGYGTLNLKVAEVD